MTEGVRDLMKDIADFYFVDGSYSIDDKIIPPESALI